MSLKEKELRTIGSENRWSLEIVKEEGDDFVVKVPGRETFVKIEDTYAEMLPKVETSPRKLPFFVVANSD